MLSLKDIVIRSIDRLPKRGDIPDDLREEVFDYQANHVCKWRDHNLVPHESCLFISGEFVIKRYDEAIVFIGYDADRVMIHYHSYCDCKRWYMDKEKMGLTVAKPIARFNIEIDIHLGMGLDYLGPTSAMPKYLLSRIRPNVLAEIHLDMREARMETNVRHQDGLEKVLFDRRTGRYRRRRR